MNYALRSRWFWHFWKRKPKNKGFIKNKVVLFDEVGYKTLAVDIVTEKGLLEPLQEE